MRMNQPFSSKEAFFGALQIKDVIEEWSFVFGC